MYRSLLLTSCALLSALVTGCGSLADNTDQHEPLAVLQGELANPDAVATSNSVRVAVVWNCGDFDGEMYRISQEVEVQPVFPSKFRLELTEPPPADCMVNPFAENEDPEQDAPVPGGGSAGGAGDPDAPPSVPNTPQDTAGSLPSDFRVGIGTIAAYDDLNGNGRLDLVDPGAPEYIDAVLGANESLMLVYLEGTLPQGWEELRDGNGNLPSLGYNLLNFNEPMIAAPDSSDVAAWCGYATGGGTDVGTGGGTSDATDEPVPMPEGPPVDTDYEEPVMEWMDAGTFFILTMSSDPRFASMMCRDGGGFYAESSGSMGSATVGQVPPQYPAPDDPGLTCMPGGVSYYYETCVDQGVCSGKMCTGECWYMPPTPPADWPCPID